VTISRLDEISISRILWGNKRLLESVSGYIRRYYSEGEKALAPGARQGRSGELPCYGHTFLGQIDEKRSHHFREVVDFGTLNWSSSAV